MVSDGESILYAPLNSHPNFHQNVIILPQYHPSINYRHRFLRLLICVSIFIFLAATAFFFLFPSNPEIKFVRLRVNHIRAQSVPKLALDLSLSLTLKVRNRDFFSARYKSLIVSVGYRGRVLGFMRSEGGRLKARGSSYIEATLDLDGLVIAHDVLYLLEDLAKGLVPFDTDTFIQGDIGIFSFNFPLKVGLSCQVYVNISSQAIGYQECYPQ